jgi:ADP-heptose:LPS heptosyltransferase
MPDILVIQLARLGDFLQTTPLLSGIKENRSDNRIHVLIDRSNAEIAKRCGCVDETICFDVDLMIDEISDRNRAEDVYKLINKHCSGFKNRYFDDVINLNYSNISAVLASLPESGRIYGYTLDNSREGLSKDSWFVYFNNMVKHSPLSPFNLVDYFYYLYCRDIRHKKLKLNLTYNDESNVNKIFHDLNIDSENKIIVVHPGIRHKKRSWPIENYLNLIVKYLEKGNIEIILTGSAEDRSLGDYLLSSLSSKDKDKFLVHDLIGKTKISETAAIIKKSDLLLCGDTGIMHLAAAVGARILSLFIGPANVYNTGPYSHGDIIIQTISKCGPCLEDIDCIGSGCSHFITPEIVFDVSMKMFSNSLSDINLPSNVKLHMSEMDDWGARYKTLNSTSDDILPLMNICYREMGKKIICRDYISNNFDKSDVDNYKIPSINSEYLNSIIKSGRIILNKAYSEKRWMPEERLKDYNSFWMPWIDSYLENSEYLDRDNNDYIYALETGLKLIDKYSSVKYEC